MNKKPQKNPLNELIVNIVLPTFILNKGAAYLGANGATKALIIALLVPICWALYDYLKFKEKNFISLLGFLSILLTGGLGLLKAEGHWFAIKEAAFPTVIGLFVLASAFFGKPLINMLINNESLIETEKIKSKLDEFGTQKKYQKHLKTSTIYFSLSFFFSAILNYILAIRIFTEIPKELEKSVREQILNQQIADMTWKGYVVILIPSMVILALVLMHLFKGVKKYTGLSVNEIMKEQKQA